MLIEQVFLRENFCPCCIDNGNKADNLAFTGGFLTLRRRFLDLHKGIFVPSMEENGNRGGLWPSTGDFSLLKRLFNFPGF